MSHSDTEGGGGHHHAPPSAALASLASYTAPLPIALKKYLCAATAASIAETVTMPLDVCKTRMQLDVAPMSSRKTSTSTLSSSAAPSSSLSLSSSSSTANPAPIRRGLVATGMYIYRTEGARRLYLGLTPAVLRQAIVGGVGVGLYSHIKDLLVHLQLARARNQPLLAAAQSFSPQVALANAAVAPPLSFGTKVLAGATSGVIGQLLAAPTCVVKVRLQADARLPVPRYQGTMDAFLTIPRQEGWKALFRGIVPSLQRAAFMYGATISTYDHFKHQIVYGFYHDEQSRRLAMDAMSTHVLSSSVSGLVASVVSTPFDTIKTRIISQPVIPRKSILGTSTALATAGMGGATVNFSAATAAAGAAATGSTGILYSSTIDCVVKTVRSEGVMAIFKGFVPCYARLAPWQMVFFISFEQLSIALTGASLR